MWSVHPTSPQLHYSCYSSQLWSGVRFQPEKNPRVRKQIIQRSSSHELPFFDWQDESNLPARISDLVDRGLGSFSNLRCWYMEERMETCHTITQVQLEAFGERAT
jgi:hypothetical protein